MRVERETGGARSSALWGRGGRGLPVALLAVLALALPVGAAAHDGSRGSGDGTYVAPGLLAKAKQSPGAKIDVIIQSDAGTAGANSAFAGVGVLHRKLATFGAVAVQIPAARLDALRKLKGLTVTPDAPVKLDGLVYSTQLWPYAQGFAPLWGNFTGAPQAPTIAVVDSGIDAGRS